MYRFLDALPRCCSIYTPPLILSTARLCPANSPG
ncbi:hypothetical protein H206_05469 [Candidatus Electrothrix aarhusensis]|uniref:Uncharacterized protein n=1 Tax=Candidatus Electrothrix aarhusensis TaxID=1859131 RepID=A0A3S3RAB9_9BACT|nr:hypothetical protein H206_05469 [Candidatus Electrothrix aarhusensis]